MCVAIYIYIYQRSWGPGGKSYSVLGGKGEERGLLPRVVEGPLGCVEEVLGLLIP